MEVAETLVERLEPRDTFSATEQEGWYTREARELTAIQENTRISLTAVWHVEGFSLQR